MEAAPELVVDPAFGHLAQRQQNHVQGFLVPGGGMISQQEVEDRGARELRERLRNRPAAGRNRGGRHRSRCRGAAGRSRARRGAGAARLAAQVLPELLHHVPGRFHDLVPIGFPGRGDLRKDGGEAGAPLARLGRKVRPAEKRLQIGRHPHRHGPAAAAGGGLHEGHVDAVHVGPLFAIHLDGHETLVQDRGDALVLERFALHDVAPVAGGVTHGKEDGLVLAARFVERFRSPRIPIHRVVGVLQQVRTLLVGQPVGVIHSETPGNSADHGGRPTKSALRRGGPRRVE